MIKFLLEIDVPKGMDGTALVETIQDNLGFVLWPRTYLGLEKCEGSIEHMRRDVLRKEKIGRWRFKGKAEE